MHEESIVHNIECIYNNLLEVFLHTFSGNFGYRNKSPKAMVRKLHLIIWQICNSISHILASINPLKFPAIHCSKVSH